MKLHRQHHGGFSLLEVLLAVVVMAIGVLGIAALQITTSLYTESSLHRSQASMLAREVVERMRVNVDEAKAGNYDITTLPSLTSSCKGASASCSASQIKDYDLQVWGTRVAAMLPSGDAIIATTADNGTDPVDVTITLQWDESRGQRATVSRWQHSNL